MSSTGAEIVGNVIRGIIPIPLLFGFTEVEGVFVSGFDSPVTGRIKIANNLIEISAEPHTGCQKFTERFGLAVSEFLRSTEGKLLRLRGINARVVEPGTVRQGDATAKVPVTPRCSGTSPGARGNTG